MTHFGADDQVTQHAFHERDASCFKERGAPVASDCLWAVLSICLAVRRGLWAFSVSQREYGHFQGQQGRIEKKTANANVMQLTKIPRLVGCA